MKSAVTFESTKHRLLAYSLTDYANWKLMKPYT